MGRLQGKTALITGGTAGIGAATVQRFAAEGAHVVFTGSNEAAAAILSDETGAVFIKHDIADIEKWSFVMDEIHRWFGRLDVVFANVGINKGDDSIEGVALDAWNHIVAVNQTAVMLTCQHGIRMMKDNPGGSSGSIIINSSINGMVGLPGDVTYTTTKGAIRLLAKSIAVHCAQNGLNIRCNSIHPGVIWTPNIQRAIDSTPDPAGARRHLEKISPMNRLGTCEEVAAAVLFLASDDASFVSGAELVVDGASTSGLSGV